MKRILITALMPICAIAAVAQTKAPVKKPGTATAKPSSVKAGAPVITLKNNLDSASYAFGSAMAASLKNNGITTLNYDLLLKGVHDAFSGTSSMLNQESGEAAIMKAFNAANEKKFGPAIAEGKAFLENNSKQPGIQVTPSGLQYQVITKGTGAAPKATDTVTVHYKGTLLNGKQFDSSYDRNEPLDLALNGVIRGWTEGVQLMQAGAKYKFFIPYQLAYGERGAGQDIPPYSTLIFEIELLKIKPANGNQ